jgi:hypothetical protein
VGSTKHQFSVLLSRNWGRGGWQNMPLTRQNMPFTLGIQTPWQKEMMIEHGHQGSVVVDATFGTN